MRGIQHNVITLDVRFVCADNEAVVNINLRPHGEFRNRGGIGASGLGDERGCAAAKD